MTIYNRSVDATYSVHVSDGDAEDSWVRLLREITDRSGLSVARLATEAGINRATIFRWLSGEVRNLNLESIRRIANAAKIDYGSTLRAAAGVAAGDVLNSADEREIRSIEELSLAPELKARVIAEVRRRQESDRRERAALVRLVTEAAGDVD